MQVRDINKARELPLAFWKCKKYYSSSVMLIGNERSFKFTPNKSLVILIGLSINKKKLSLVFSQTNTKKIILVFSVNKQPILMQTKTVTFNVALIDGKAFV